MQDSPTAMTQKQVQFAYNLIKGRVGESLVEQLLMLLGFSVRRFGIETLAPIESIHMGGRETEEARFLRRLPDFLAFPSHSGPPMMVEVKTWYTGKPPREYFSVVSHYPKRWLIVVSAERGIFAVSQQRGLELAQQAGNSTHVELPEDCLMERCPAFTNDRPETKEIVCMFRRLAEHVLADWSKPSEVAQEVLRPWSSVTLKNLGHGKT